MANVGKDVYQLHHTNFWGTFFFNRCIFPAIMPQSSKALWPMCQLLRLNFKGSEFTLQSPLSSLLPAHPGKHHWEMSAACTCLLSTQGADPKFKSNSGISELWSVLNFQCPHHYTWSKMSAASSAVPRGRGGTGRGYIGSFFISIWKVISPVWRNSIHRNPSLQISSIIKIFHFMKGFYVRKDLDSSPDLVCGRLHICELLSKSLLAWASASVKITFPCPSSRV